MLNLQIKNIHWQDTLPVRHKVLWPDKDIRFCQIDGDEDAKHYAVYIDNKPVSVASLFIEQDSIQLRKFATLQAYQGKGIGTHLLQHTIKESKSMGARRFWCDARKNSKDFYSRFGMHIEGEAFIKYGRPYYKMVINLN